MRYIYVCSHCRSLFEAKWEVIPHLRGYHDNKPAIFHKKPATFKRIMEMTYRWDQEYEYLRYRKRFLIKYL